MRKATDSSPRKDQPDESIADALLPASSVSSVFPASATASTFTLIGRDCAAAAPPRVALGEFDPWSHTGWIARGAAETWALGPAACPRPDAGAARSPKLAGAANLAVLADVCARFRRRLDRPGMSGFDRHGSGNALRRVRAEDKRLLDCRADANQLLPVKYHWARDHYLAACEADRRWLPAHIDMARDVECWRDPDGLSDVERRVVRRTLGFFASASALAASTVALGLYRHVTNPECRQFLLRQAARAEVHVDACEHIVASLDLDAGEIFNMCHEVPSMRDRIEFLLPFMDTLTDPDLRTDEPQSDQRFLACLIVFVCLMQGLFFESAAAPIVEMGRRARMTGTARHFRHVLRDLSAQRDFGIELIREIKRENPRLWTDELRSRLIELFRVALGLEYRSLDDTLEGAAAGLDIRAFKRHARCLADRGSRETGLGPLYARGATAADPVRHEAMRLRAVAP